jgi:hypothetical protein
MCLDRETQSKTLQKLQDRAARIIMNMSNDIDHSVALQTLGWNWKPLKTERKKSKAKIMYKLFNKMGPNHSLISSHIRVR